MSLSPTIRIRFRQFVSRFGAQPFQERDLPSPADLAILALRKAGFLEWSAEGYAFPPLVVEYAQLVPADSSRR